MNFESEFGILTTIIGSIGAFCWSVYKWWSTRDRQLKAERYRNYLDLISQVAGHRQDSTNANLTEQMAAVWCLLEYKEYYATTTKIFSTPDLENIGVEHWKKFVVPEVRQLLDEISRHGCHKSSWHA